MTQLSPVKQITELYKRLERAHELVDEERVFRVAGREDVHIVQGSSGYYLVGEDGCTCEDAKFGAGLHHGYCKHRLAVCLYVESHAPAEPVPVFHDDLDERLADLF